MNRLLCLAAILLFLTGCNLESRITAPGDVASPAEKNGTEVLGAPSIAIAAGSGFVEGGVGMVGVESAELTVDVPAGSQVVQALLYWAGGSTAPTGDDEISLDGTLIQGELIGGPTLFYDVYSFSAYRADITGLDLVQPGSNTFTVADFNFAGTYVDENDGATLLVIYDDGGEAVIDLRDGLDMAFFGFAPTLNSTIPQIFAVELSDEERMAELVIVAASVGENRPNRIRVTTSAGEQFFDNPLGSYDGLQWDSTKLDVVVPAGVDELSVELVSTVSYEPLGASLGWLVAGLSLVVVPDLESFVIDGEVFGDTDRDGAFEDFEWGLDDVVVELRDQQGLVATATTDFMGAYAFEAPAGDYTVVIDLAGHAGSFNEDLATLWDPTTPLSLPVTLGPAATGVNFGFVPRTDQILQDLDDGTLASDALSPRHWRKLLRRALIEETSNRQGNGHDNGDSADSGGWGHDENYFSGEEIIAFLGAVESLYLVDPYRFTPGNELREAYDLISSKPKQPEGQLLRELLVTELNFVAGRGLQGQDDVLGALIAWGESLLNTEEDEGKAARSGADKSRSGDLIKATQVFGAINTGGGGSVDE